MIRETEDSLDVDFSDSRHRDYRGNIKRRGQKTTSRRIPITSKEY